MIVEQEGSFGVDLGGSRGEAGARLEGEFVDRLFPSPRLALVTPLIRMRVALLNLGWLR